jgi:excisionase family DNA binding protein
MTLDELRALPALLDVPTAARVLGVGRTAAYRMVSDGSWPTPVVRVGRKVKVPTLPLLSLLGIGRELLGA